MAKNSYLEKRKLRLSQLHGLLDLYAQGHDNAIKYIEQNIGSPINCLESLSHDARVKAMLAWFEQNDLNALRQWSYVSSKLMQLYHQMKTAEGSTLKINAGPYSAELLEPLLSNNNELIDWFAHYDEIYDMKRVEKVSTVDFMAYQAVVALKGDWPRLIERCNNVIAKPPSSLGRYNEYHHFWLALARGDKQKMEQALQKMANPRVLRTRTGEESPISEDLIFTRIIICMKIAWRNGFEIKVDSPYVPMEWMPNEPLQQYDNHYSFLKVPAREIINRPPPQPVEGNLSAKIATPERAVNKSLGISGRRFWIYFCSMVCFCGLILLTRK
jgi:Immunity protein 49